ncbi:pyridoxal-phosphate dependent enzyme [Dyadobacter frigoris]|uniref:Pyridoxal-phosphate dependent enzyme n=1 Tax=Dyadobacter frigoris TaxID=2576211 RepID=A0A4U6CS27_9BACT|nr:pyridoxal-phosphate dependent enzyme [Dyadobacter frigoris]TKT86986.1 pyridoxal-phosphate dependent enzyme [Dyadobacter frigoris]GLU52823.1 threonine synthase [Dyadobacter frigoris]
MKTIWKYESFLPDVPEQYRLSLGEGDTPLIKSGFIGNELGLSNLYFKLENLNPTGSYKDRFAAVLVSEMRAAGQKVCIATSSGNTGAALSAYCAAAGITCMLVVVDGAPESKVKQMQLYGAQILMVKDFGKNAETTSKVFDDLEKICSSRQLPLPISAYRYCPSAMQGVETIVYEIQEMLPDGVDQIFVPAGGGGLTLAITKGVFSSSFNIKVNCVQPEGNDTIASALRKGEMKAKSVSASFTAVSGLQVANVIDGDQVINNCRKLGGNGYVVNDPDVFKWQKMLARKEGIFCEPAGAVALAGLADAIARKEIGKNETVVCLVTGSGFKDMMSVDRNFELPEVKTLSRENCISTIEECL